MCLGPELIIVAVISGVVCFIAGHEFQINGSVADPECRVDDGGKSSNSFVFLREFKGVNCKHWTARVHYDAWGSPYVYNARGTLEIGLKKDGGTTDTYLYGTEWQHRSGPDVTFRNVRSGVLNEQR